MPVTADELNKSTSFCFSELATSQGLTPKKLINEIKLIALSDVSNHVDVDEGGALQFKDLKKQGMKRRAIQALEEKTVITETKDGALISKVSTVKFKLHPKMEAIEQGLAIHGMKKQKEMKLSGSLGLVTDADITNEEREAVLLASRIMREKMNGKSRSAKKSKGRPRKG